MFSNLCQIYRQSDTNHINVHTVDGRHFTNMLSKVLRTSLAHFFGIRCLPGDTRTFSPGFQNVVRPFLLRRLKVQEEKPTI